MKGVSMAAVVITIPDNFTCGEYEYYLRKVVDNVGLTEVKMKKYKEFKQSVHDAHYFNCGIVIHKIIEEE